MNQKKSPPSQDALKGAFSCFNDRNILSRYNVKKCRSKRSRCIWSVYRMSQNVVDTSGKVWYDSCDSTFK